MSENLLRYEASPYLLQHKDNPVHWRAWGPAALAEAREAGKPILLSVGYAACHWCHVMAHESFEDDATAAVMNRLFVNIKVDREERPEVDQIYMAALHALGEQGGWPLTMFLTPDGEPIWGGTYFPKISRHGRPAFVDVLEEVARVFRDEPQTIANNRGLLLERLQSVPGGQGIVLDRDLLDRAATRLLELVDTQHGGTSGAPKFPQPGLIELFWRAAGRTKEARFTNAILLTLRSICQGGIYDHIGGGFARYSVDDRWLVPHFEKMLYDNAQLVDLLTRAWLATGDRLFRARIEETVAWLSREMLLPGGGFAASLDADSEGHEGRFYVWTLNEVLDALGPEEGRFFAEAYDITTDGNWEGVSIPNRIGEPFPDAADEERLAAARARLLERRAGRVRPGTDDKILADWNGLLISALAFAGASLERPDWVEMAATAFHFAAKSMTDRDRLAHSWRGGKRIFPGLATDYAAMVKAALSLHAATFDPAWLVKAETFAAALRRHHWDADEPGYFLSADDAEALIVRPRSAIDEATPAANSVMTANLVRLWRITGRDHYRDDADAILSASAPVVAHNLFSTLGILNALDFRLGATDVVIVVPGGKPDPEIIAAVRLCGDPNLVLTLHEETARLPSDHPATGKTAIGGKTTVYVCRGESCSLPVSDPAALTKLLGTTVP